MGRGDLRIALGNCVRLGWQITALDYFGDDSDCLGLGLVFWPVLPTALCSRRRGLRLSVNLFALLMLVHKDDEVLDVLADGAEQPLVFVFELFGHLPPISILDARTDRLDQILHVSPSDQYCVARPQLIEGLSDVGLQSRAPPELVNGPRVVLEYLREVCDEVFDVLHEAVLVGGGEVGL